MMGRKQIIRILQTGKGIHGTRGMAATFITIFIFWSIISATASGIIPGWSQSSCVSESPTAVGSPHLTELTGANGEPFGRTLLTYFQYGADGVARIGYRTSDDGVNWSSPGVIPGTENSLDPSATQLPDGEVLVVYAHYRQDSNSVEVSLTRSRDLVNWSPPQSILSFPDGNNAFVPNITALRDGRVLLAYSRGVEPLWSDIYLVESRDGGHSWGRSNLIYGGAQYDSKAELIELDNGDLLVSFYISPPFSYGRGSARRGDIFTVRSANGGATWSRPSAIAADAARDECWTSLLQQQNGELWAAFTIDEGDKDPRKPPSIQLKKSFDRGLTWDAGETVSEMGQRRTWPALARRSDGTTMLIADDDAWYDTKNRAYWSMWQWNTAGKISSADRQLWPWYDDVGSRDWVMVANLGANPIYEKTSIDGRPIGGGWVGAGDIQVQEFPGVIGGPLEVSSIGGGSMIASQRIIWGNSFEEIPSIGANRISDSYYWTWYDMRSPGFTNWIVVSNPSDTPVYYEISIAGKNPGAGSSGTIAAGGNANLDFPGQMNGPVELKAYADASKTQPAKVIAAQRVLSNYGAAFNELPGIPAAELSNHYLWTWYDQASPGFKDWVVIANPSDTPVTYEIKIGGVTMPVSAGNPGTIPARGRVTPAFPGPVNGPVEVIASASVIASQRVIAGHSFEEVPGFPQQRLANRWLWTWYDMQSPGSIDWMLIANPNDVAVDYEVRIAGKVMPTSGDNPGTIPPRGKVTPVFPGSMNGPVEVISTGGKVMASQRVLWNGHFNEVLGTVR